MPRWFHYPEPFLRLVETGITEFRPWRLLEGAFAAGRMLGLRERFPERELVPFALRRDCDDVACWERGNPEGVVIIHDFAKPGWEDVAVFGSFWEWFRSAIEDFIDFEA